MKTPLTCPSLEDLRKFISGASNEAENESIEHHFLRCPECLKRTSELEFTDPLITAIRNIESQSPGDEFLSSKRFIELQASLHNLRIGGTCQADQDTRATLEDLSPEGVDSTRSQQDLEAVAKEFAQVFEPPCSEGELGRFSGYRVESVLGAGGMGVVFLAEDLHLHRRVALKLMRPKIAIQQDAADRLLCEARAAAALQHDNVIRIYQVFEAKGIPCIAMELLQGQSLETLLKLKERLPIDTVLRIGYELCEALAAAHRAGLIHRDVKPANIWLEGASKTSGSKDDRFGIHRRVKLLDFGLARSVNHDARLTAAGMIVGTPAYMAPEQASGDTVDARTDLFSLGVILYQMSTGSRPFAGKHVLQILRSLATQDPLPASSVNQEIPQELSDLIGQLLAKSSHDRPASAALVAEAIAGIQEKRRHVAIGGPRRVSATGTDKDKTRRRILLSLGLAAVSGLMSGIVFFQTKWGILRVEITDPSLSVQFDDKSITFENDGTSIRVQPNEKHSLTVKANGVAIEGGTREVILRRGDERLITVSLLEGKAAIDGVPIDKIESGTKSSSIEMRSAVTEARSATTQLAVAAMFERERKAVQRLVELGGTGNLRLPNGQLYKIRHDGSLPQGRFHCLSIVCDLTLSSQDMDLFVGLPLLTSADLRGERFAADAWDKLALLRGLRFLGIYSPLTGKDVDCYTVVSKLPALRRLHIHPRTLIQSPRLNELDQITHLGFFFAAGNDISLLTGFPGLKRLKLEGYLEKNDDALLSLQQRRPYVQVIVGDGPSTRYVGEDLWGPMFLKLIEQGCELKGQNLREGTFNVPMSAEMIREKVPFLLDYIDIPKTAELSDEMLTFLSESPIQSFKCRNGHPKAIEFVRRMAKAENLNSVNLENTPVSDSDLTAFDEFPFLQVIFLQGAGVSERGIETLRKKFPYCHITGDHGTYRGVFESP